MAGLSESAAGRAACLKTRVCECQNVDGSWGDACTDWMCPRCVRRWGQKVRFNNDPIFLEIPPYSEVYGCHPRQFDFGRYGEMISAVVWQDHDPRDALYNTPRDAHRGIGRDEQGGARTGVLYNSSRSYNSVPPSGTRGRIGRMSRSDD